jgi:2-polyprenyl-6-methoxyphenol hydroxylase-like FAD-dependent oxidoreductase
MMLKSLGPKIAIIGGGIGGLIAAVALAHRGLDAIHLGARCTGFRQTSQAVTACFQDGREVPADVLVGADGVHSVVRATLLGPAPLRYRGSTVRRIAE